jgi:hypothetical protein
MLLVGVRLTLAAFSSRTISSAPTGGPEAGGNKLAVNPD